jgi:hypothetical protein
MKAAGKAKGLVDKFMNVGYGVIGEYVPCPQEAAKQCALICVDEIETALDFNGGGWDGQYWQQVRNEITKI